MTRPRGADLALLAVVTLVNVLALPREEYVGDPVAIRIETISLLRTGRLGVPAEIASRMGTRGQYFYENRGKGRWFPKYGVLNTLMYVPPLMAERMATGSLPWLSPRRVAFLNIYNLLLAAATAAYLLAVVSLYTRRAVVQWIYVLSALYATFWWNYLRAHTSEIYQTLFVIALYWHLARHLRAVTDGPGDGVRRPFPRHLLAATIWLGALCLTKLSFLILVPAVAVVLFAAEHEANRLRPGASPGERLWPSLVGFVVPVAGLLGALAAMNAYKFGSPVLTGYEQMVEERGILTGSLLTGLHGFLVSAQGSVFTHFPPLFFALAGFPAFLRKRPMETTLITVAFVALLLLNSQFRNWQGAACYGPRYMLPVLPVASLPFLEVLEWVRGRWRTALGAAVGLALAGVLGWSAVLQDDVNALPFFAFHHARNAVILHGDVPEDGGEFFRRSVPQVDRDLLRYWKGSDPLEVLEAARGRVDPAAAEAMRRGIEAQLRSNYLWFENGPPPGAARP